MAQTVKRLPTMQETWVRTLGQEDPLEKEMATHSSILAWKIPWTEEPGWLLSMGSQRVGHKWMTSLSLMILLYTCLHLNKHIYRASFGTSVLNCLSLSLLSNSAEMSVFRHMLSYFSIKSLQNHTSGYYTRILKSERTLVFGDREVKGGQFMSWIWAPLAHYYVSDAQR